LEGVLIIRVLVTGAAGAIGMDVAFSLNKIGVYTIGTEADKDNFLLVKQSCKYYSNVYKISKAGRKEYKDEINDIISKENIDIVIPNPDSEISFISSIRDEIEADMLLPSDKTVQFLLSKLKTAQKLGDLAPRTYEVSGKKDLEKIIRVEKKVWLRPRKGAGGRGALVTSNPEFGWMWIEYWRKKGLSSWIAQEFLEGGNYNVTLIYDITSKLCGVGMMERFSYIHGSNSPTGITGDVRIAVTTKKRKIIGIAEKAVKKIDKRPIGIFSVDLKGEKVTEINPRFAGRPRLYTESGANFPKQILEIVENGTSQYIEAKEGYRLIRQVDIEPVVIKYAKG
jgi:predicted ATP-grasp superfamily ATP-dependent carboligase